MMSDAEHSTTKNRNLVMKWGPDDDRQERASTSLQRHTAPTPRTSVCCRRFAAVPQYDGPRGLVDPEWASNSGLSRLNGTLNSRAPPRSAAFFFIDSALRSDAPNVDINRLGHGLVDGSPEPADLSRLRCRSAGTER